MVGAWALADGTRVEILSTGTRITLPSGEVVSGEPMETCSYRATAAELGYGDDTAAMCRDHDPMHAMLCDWLGVPSLSLGVAAGTQSESRVALLEEAAVLAVQKFMRATGRAATDIARRCELASKSSRA